MDSECSSFNQDNLTAFMNRNGEDMIRSRLMKSINSRDRRHRSSQVQVVNVAASAFLMCSASRNSASILQSWPFHLTMRMQMQPRLTNPAHTTNIQPEKGINQKIFVSQFSKNTVETHHLRDYPREIDVSTNTREVKITCGPGEEQRFQLPRRRIFRGKRYLRQQRSMIAQHWHQQCMPRNWNRSN